MKKILTTLLLLTVAVASFAQSRTISADRVIVYDSLYLNGRWVTRETVDSIGTGGGGTGSGSAVDTIYVSNDTLYYKKNGNTLFQKLPSGGGSAFFIGVSPDQHVANTVTKAHIGGVAFFSDGSISAYTWSQTAGTPTTTLDSSNVPFTTVSGLQPGTTYTYKLTATNSAGATKHASVNIIVDSILLRENEYFINDSANFNFGPLSQNILHWTDVSGDPSQEVVSAEAPNGWGVTSVGLWNPDTSGTSATAGGEPNPLINDFEGFFGDSAIMSTHWVADSTSYASGKYNLMLTGLDPDQQYILQITGSVTGDDNSDFYRVNYYAYSNGNAILRELNAYSNTSWYVQFDTLSPDASGNIKLFVGGVDSSGAFWKNGYISAMKVWAVSKTVHSGYIAKLKTFADSAVVNLNDGETSRSALVYYPQHEYDPGKKYPIIFYISGAESSGTDINAVRQYGLARLEEAGHDLYGIKANGDTVRFVVVVPQYTLVEAGFSALKLHTMLQNFKTSYADIMPIDTSNCYATGFSYGGGAMIRWQYLYPNDLKATAALSPVTSGLTSEQIGELADQFGEDSVFLMLLPHSDQSLAISEEVYDSVTLHSPGFALYDQWYGRLHDGFNKQMDTSFRIGLINQSIFDFMVNPTKNAWSAAKFAFTEYDKASTRYDPGIISCVGNPADSVISHTDPVSGITIKNIDNDSWGGVTSTGITALPGREGSTFGTYAYQECWYTNSGTNFATSGANMEASGLDPNTDYEITVLGSTTLTNRVIRVGTDGSNFADLDCVNNEKNFATITATSDATGKIQFYVYGAPGSSGYGIMNALIIRKK